MAGTGHVVAVDRIGRGEVEPNTWEYSHLARPSRRRPHSCRTHVDARRRTRSSSPESRVASTSSRARKCRRGANVSCKPRPCRSASTASTSTCSSAHDVREAARLFNFRLGQPAAAPASAGSAQARGADHPGRTCSSSPTAGYDDMLDVKDILRDGDVLICLQAAAGGTIGYARSTVSPTATVPGISTVAPTARHPSRSAMDHAQHIEVAFHATRLRTCDHHTTRDPSAHGETDVPDRRSVRRRMRPLRRRQARCSP